MRSGRTIMCTVAPDGGVPGLEGAAAEGPTNAEPFPAFGPAPGAGGGTAGGELGVLIEHRCVDERGTGRDGRGVRKGRGAGLGEGRNGIGAQGTVHRIRTGQQSRAVADAAEGGPVVGWVLAARSGGGPDMCNCPVGVSMSSWVRLK